MVWPWRGPALWSLGNGVSESRAWARRSSGISDRQVRSRERSEANEASGGALWLDLSARLSSRPGIRMSAPVGMARSAELPVGAHVVDACCGAAEAPLGELLLGRRSLGRWRRRSVLRHGPRGLGRAVGMVALVCALAGCGRSESQLQEAVGTFEAPVEWVELTESTMSGEQREGLCIGSIDCHVSLVIQWRAPEKPTLASLKAAADAAGWERIESDRTCEDDGDYCSLRAQVGDVTVNLGRRPNAGSWIVRLSGE